MDILRRFCGDFHLGTPLEHSFLQPVGRFYSETMAGAGADPSHDLTEALVSWALGWIISKQAL